MNRIVTWISIITSIIAIIISISMGFEIAFHDIKEAILLKESYLLGSCLFILLTCAIYRIYKSYSKK